METGKLLTDQPFANLGPRHVAHHSGIKNFPVTYHHRGGAPLFRMYFRGGEHPGAWNTFRNFGPLTPAVTTLLYSTSQFRYL